MSSASGATETEFNAEERSRNRAKLVSANVPAIVYERGMSFYSPDSDRVREYLQSGAFKEDSAAHRGIYLCGNNPKRSDIFATVAKVLVLNDLPVYFTSLHGLVGALENDAERKNYLGRVGHLFIDNLQRRYVSEPDHCPYPRAIMAEVEELFEYRRTRSHTTHLSSSMELAKITWIGQETVETLKSVTTSITL